MNRKQKIVLLISIIIFSLPIIYNKNINSQKTILNLGDQFSLGIDSYGIKDYGYIEYYKDYIEKKYHKVTIKNQYAKKELSIKELNYEIVINPKLKKDLRDSSILFLSIGYNDLLYQLSVDKKQKSSKIIKKVSNDYKKLIQEIQKYHHQKIIIVGYSIPKGNNKKLQNIIKKWNKILKNSNKVIFIDSEKILKPQTKYFSNPNNTYPNKQGYQAISNKIIQKHLKNNK